MKIRKSLLMVCAIAIACTSMSQTAEAKKSDYFDDFDYYWYTADDYFDYDNYKPEEEAAGIKKSEFDYVDYAKRYPDIQAACGANKEMLFKHYKTFGVAEGRRARVTKESYYKYANCAPYTNKVNAILRIYDLAEELVPAGATDEQKVRIIHDWIINNTSYGFTSDDACYGVEGPILYGVSVCQGYSETFQAFMDVLGVECEKIVGQADNGSSSGGHAWNRVKLNGTWYNIDVCWDDPICSDGTPVLRYDYYLISDQQISVDHFASIYGNYL